MRKQNIKIEAIWKLALLKTILESDVVRKAQEHRRIVLAEKVKKLESKQ